MALTRVTITGWRQESGSLSRVTINGWRQESSATAATTITATHSINGALQKSATATFSINSALQKAVTATFSINAAALEPFHGRPISDVSAGAWLPSTGSDLYATIDEVDFDDVDYNYVSSASTFEVKLTPLVDPLRSTNHLIKFRVPADFVPAGNLKVSLRQGTGTEIAVAYDGAVTAGTTYTYDLTGLEADAITDYTDLRLRFVAS